MRASLAALLCAVLPALALAQSPGLVSIEGGPGARHPGKASHHHTKNALTKAERAGALTLRARSIEIEGRWAEGLDLGLAVCDVVTPENISAAMEALEAAITRSPAATLALGSQGAAEVLYIDVKYDTRPGTKGECGNAAKTVGIVFRPFHLRVSLARAGDNVLPLPRPPMATVFDQVPAPLRVLNPRFGVSHDKAFGSAVSAGIDTNLRALGAAPKEVGASARANPLDAHLQRVQSTRAGYFRNDAGLTYRLQRHGSALQEVRLRVSDSQSREPLAGGEQSHAAGELGLGLTWKPAHGLRVALDTGWRGSRDDVSDAAGAMSRTESRRWAGRALLDAQAPPGAGFARAALWHEGASVDAASHFARVAAQLGYAREFNLGDGPTWGLELLAGAGRLSSRTPEVDRFFAGNAAGQFLYDGAGSPSMLQLPRGPLLRSVGQGQGSLAAQRGGNRYWHFNANLALPIRAWSEPLIPDESTGLDDPETGKPVRIKALLRKQVDVSGPSMLAATLATQGISDAEATRQAADSFAEIQPAVHYLVDSASLYAVRPLLLLDVAGLSDSASASSARWVAVGAGVGLSIVTARIEAGYMHTVSGPRLAGGRGAAFMRIVFQNLF